MKPLHEVTVIETPEQLELELPLAGVASRAIAYILDLMWQVVPIALVAIAAVTFLPGPGTAEDWDARDEQGRPRLALFLGMVVNVVMFVVNFGYFAFFEVFWTGQTPGKRSMRLRVVRDGGYPLDGRAALLRNLLRVVDFLPLFYLVGIATLFLGRQGKRLGDYAAGTFVVQERDLQAAPDARLAAEGKGPLTPAERDLVSAYLSRRFQLDDEHRERVARQLADRLAARLGRPAPLDAQRFLEELEREGLT